MEQDYQVNANGFTVLNAEDGYRKDNSLWFGECSVCGERVSNSRLVGKWEHTLVLQRSGLSRTTKQIDYCPAV